MTEGVVDIASDNKENMQKAIDWIKGICAVPEVGTVYHGKVVSILEFGAFVEILPGKEGLLHVSEIAWTKTENVEDVLKVGDEIDVKLLEIDAKTGKMRLSMRALTEKPEGYVEPKPRSNGPRRDGDRRDGNRGGHNDRGPRRDGDRRDDRRDSDRRERRDGERREHRDGERRDFRRPRPQASEEAPAQDAPQNDEIF
jgi:polyribonucleotide nucleotidyltransferase